MLPPPHHQALIDRFASTCQTDERVEAAILGGSYARGTADAYSDVDLYLITRDDAYEDFLAGWDAFVRQLGEPVFLEDFGVPHAVFFIFADGTEGELGIGPASGFLRIHSGPYQVLLDKQGVLAGALFSQDRDRDAQVEVLRRQVNWFWHDLSHFITRVTCCPLSQSASTPSRCRSKPNSSMMSGTSTGLSGDTIA